MTEDYILRQVYPMYNDYCREEEPPEDDYEDRDFDSYHQADMI